MKQGVGVNQGRSVVKQKMPITDDRRHLSFRATSQGAVSDGVAQGVPRMRRRKDKVGKRGGELSMPLPHSQGAERTRH